MTTDKRIYNNTSRFMFPLLRTICAMAPGTYMPMSEFRKKDQRFAGPLYHRGWVAYRPGKGIHATDEGRTVCDEYMMGEARDRNNPDRPLSHYFDPIAYKLRPEQKKGKVHVMHRRGHAA